VNNAPARIPTVARISPYVAQAIAVMLSMVHLQAIGGNLRTHARESV
jgi:hypothetical protein